MSAEKLRFFAKKVGVLVSLEQAYQLKAFDNLLIKWTKRFNLVSANTLNDSVIRHVLDSLSIGPYLEDSEHFDKSDTGLYDLLDVGSGAGLPVLPLAIAFPERRFASVETNGKKVRFQRQVVLELGLKNLDVFEQRIESVQLQATQVTSRAFAAPANFLQLVTDKCTAGGSAIIMLGQAEKMPEALPDPWRLNSVQPVDVPGESGQRHVALCIRGTLNL